MTDLERALLNMVQRDFPLDPRPFRVMADRLGISEKECIMTLKRLSSSGILRAIRPVVSWNRLGFSTILVGMKVDHAHVEAIAERINRMEGVTHNYTREGSFNLWFTLIYDDDREKESLIASLVKEPGVQDVREFKAEKTYKIGLVLDV